MKGLHWLNWVGHVLLGVGLFAPCMTVTPRLGAYTGLGQWLGLVQAPRTYSILEGVRALLDNNALLGAIVFVFSVVFPLSKLVILRAGIADTIAGGRASGAQRITTVLSKYSMVDVFVIALLIV
ncbi:MAG: paraquat-inducible protein A, partial [Planctomycetota bacterium]